MPAAVHKLSFDDYASQAMISHHTDWAGMDDNALRSGERLCDYWRTEARFVMERDKECDLLWVVGLRPVFSDRLKCLAESHGITNVEYYPMSVEHVDGRPMGRYWYVNVLKIEGALDMDASLYKRVFIEAADREAFILIKPVLRASATAQYDLFRLAESTAGVYVSDRFRRLYEDHACSGAVFFPQPVL